jgi:hypothetical protein
MTDFYPLAKHLSDYVEQVIAHLALQMEFDAATGRVMEHLRTVLQAGLEGTRPDDMAFVLMKPEHTSDDATFA